MSLSMMTMVVVVVIAVVVLLTSFILFKTMVIYALEQHSQQEQEFKGSSQSSVAFARIVKCLSVIYDGKEFYFIFVDWYERIQTTGMKTLQKRHRYFPPLVKVWKPQGLVIPLTPRSIIRRVWCVHNCIRFCSRHERIMGAFESSCENPLQCNCNLKCKIMYWCPTHNTHDCIICPLKNKITEDVHCESKEYFLFDLDWGFQNSI